VSAKGFGGYRLTSGESIVVSTQNRRVLISTVSRRIMGAVVFNVVSKNMAAESADPVEGPSEGHRIPISIRPISLRDYYMTSHRPLHQNQVESRP